MTSKTLATGFLVVGRWTEERSSVLSDAMRERSVWISSDYFARASSIVSHSTRQVEINPLPNDDLRVSLWANVCVAAKWLAAVGTTQVSGAAGLLLSVNRNTRNIRRLRSARDRPPSFETSSARHADSRRGDEGNEMAVGCLNHP